MVFEVVRTEYLKYSLHLIDMCYLLRSETEVWRPIFYQLGTRTLQRSTLNQVPANIKQYLLESVETPASHGKLTKEDIYEMPSKIRQGVFPLQTGEKASFLYWQENMRHFICLGTLSVQ